MHHEKSIAENLNIFYEVIEKMYPGRKYLELFGTKKRLGWER